MSHFDYYIVDLCVGLSFLADHQNREQCTVKVESSNEQLDIQEDDHRERFWVWISFGRHALKGKSYSIMLSNAENLTTNALGFQAIPPSAS